MKKFYLALMAFSVLYYTSCNKDDNDYPDDKPVVIQNDIEKLKIRVAHDNSGILSLSAASDLPKLKSTNAATIDATENPDFALALVAQVAPPEYEGNRLRATHVTVAGKYAYVSYNTEGEKYLGGVDVIDISDINNPKLVVNAKLPNINISSLTIDGNNLVMAGAAAEGVLSNLLSPAVMIVLPLSNGLPTSAYRYTGTTSYVATDVTFNTESYYTVSGSKGAISKIGKSSGTIEKSTDIEALLAIKTYQNQIFALSGTQGVNILTNNLEPVRKINTVLNPTGTKRTIDFFNNLLLVSEGSQGLGIYDINTGALDKRISIPVSAADAGTDPQDIVTNAVSTNDKRVFVANGGVGIASYQFDAQNNVTYLGSISFNAIDNSSSNFVMSQDNYVFVASGKGGLKILKLTELKPAQPTCSGTFPTYTGSTQWDLNINDAANYADSKTFGSSVNINRDFTWCGSLGVNGNAVNVNGGIFNMYGTLTLKENLNVNRNMNLNGSATIGGTFTVNGGATWNVNGSVAQGGAGQKGTSTVNGKMIINGEVIVYGNLTINGSGRVEFADSKSKLIVYGNLTNWGTVTNGSITQVK